MKLTRRRLLVGSVVAVAAVGGAWLAIAERGPSKPPFGVTRSAYRAIRMGMTPDDVGRIIGDPGGYVVNYGIESERETYESLLPAIGQVEWVSDEGRILLSINEDDLVCEKRFYWEPMRDRLLRQLRSIQGKLGF